MNLPHFLSRRSWIIAAIIILVFLIYVLLQFFVFHSDPVVRFLISAIDSFLVLAEKISGQVLIRTGYGITIANHLILQEEETLLVNDSGVFMKKWIIIMLILFWITRTSTKKKILFTVITLIASFISGVITITLSAYLAGVNFDSDSAYRIARTFGVLMIIFITQIWIRKNKASILETLSKIKINTNFINLKMPVVFLVIYLYAFASNFIYGYLNFGLWIDLLFNATKGLLSVFGIDAAVEPYLLTGDNGSLYMARPCLGFNTILLFASIVYLTGTNNLKRWSYIITGFIFLNIVNIIRFALIFIHVQKYGAYMLKIDIHNMYTYITYAIVFIMWIIWFEFFTDIKILN